MLVLNRRPGESIIIEPGVIVTVLSVAERRVWIRVDAPEMAPLRISAVLGAPTEARLEVGPLAGVSFDDGGVSVTVGHPSHAAAALGATLALNCRPGEGVTVAGGARVGIASVAKGNPCVALSGTAIGGELRLTLIRPAGNYVRLGVDAPDRRVFRRELWDSVQARDGADRPAAVTRPRETVPLAEPGLAGAGVIGLPAAASDAARPAMAKALAEAAPGTVTG